MPGCAHRRGTLAGLALASALLALAASAADAPAPAVFAGAASEGMPERILEPGGRGPAPRPDPPGLRMARLDFGSMAAVREAAASGRGAAARLNLFEDAEFDWIVRRAAATAGGYSLSGPLAGVEAGTATLVANGGMVVGSAWTPEAEYRIRTVGRTQIVERVDPSRWPACDGTFKVGAALPGGATARVSSADAPDDGSEIDLLVVYTPHGRRKVGGHRAMLAEIDHEVAWANEALAASGAAHRARLVGAAEVDYRQPDDTRALAHLAIQGDGHMDEVHALRDRLAADAVVLKTAWIGGAYGLLFPDNPRSVASFGAADVGGNPSAIAHVLGHVMGAHHDRESYNGNLPFPYSHGYELPDVRRDGVYPYWTIMGSSGGNMPRFSNPRQRFRGVALGVPGDEPSSRVDGPADAVRSMDETRRLVANHRRSAARCRYRLSPPPEVPAAGGTYSLRVEADAGCAWTARAADGFTTVVSGSRGTGDGTVTYRVPANAGWEREAALAVAGRMRVAVQPGTRPVKPVCERGAAVREALEAELGAECADIAAADLARVVELVLGHIQFRLGARHARVAPGDFDGLSNLGYLRLRVEVGETLLEGTFDGLSSLAWLEMTIHGLVPLRPGSFRGLENLIYLVVHSGERGDLHDAAPLPPGTFEGMPRLRELVLWDRIRATIAPGLFDGLSSLDRLNVVGDLAHLPPGAFRGLPGLRRLEVDNSFGGSPLELEAGVFDGLPSLRELVLNSLAGVPPGLFAGLSELQALWLEYNAFDSLEAGAFDGLSSLHSLFLDNDNPRYAHSPHRHELRTLPPGLFAGLPRLALLDLGGVGLRELRPGAFREAGATLRFLRLPNNRLAALDAGTFDGAPGLLALHLDGNRLEELPPGLFDGLRELQLLRLDGNRLERLPPGPFKNLAWLNSLALHDNRLAALPPELFAGAGAGRPDGPYLLTLHGNPGAPFALPLEPVVASAPWRRPVRVGVRIAEGAPLALDVPLDAVGGALEARSASLAPGAVLSDSLAAWPDGGEPVVVRVGAIPDLPGAECAAVVDAGRPCQTLARTGMALAAGAPLVLNAIPDRSLAACDFPQRIGLADVFLEFAGGELAYAARSSDPATVDAYVGGGTLAVRALKAGAATVTVTATAADGRTAARTFAVDAEGACAVKPVCERSAAARDAIAAAAGRECGEVTAEDLAALAALEVGAPPSPGDFDGLSGLRRLDATVADGGLAANTFHGLGGLAELRLRGGRVAAGPGAFDGLRSLRLLRARFSELRPGAFRDLAQVAEMELGGGGLGALEPGVFDDVPNLVGLGLSGNGLSRLRPGVFRGLSRLVRLSLGRNALAALEPGAFGGLDSLRHLDLSRNRLSALPPDLLRGLPGLRTLELAHNRLGALPERFFAGAGVGRLSLHGNPGAPFVLRAAPRRAPGSGQGRGFASRVAVHVPQGAPVALDFRLSASGGRLDGSRSRADAPVASGGTRSRAWDVAPDGAGPVAVAAELFADLAPEGCGEDTRLPAFEDDCLTGLHVEVGRPLVLNGVPDGRLSTDDRWRVALENVFLEFPMAGTSYAASSSDPAVAEAAVEGGALVVTPRREGEAAVTITATAADGRTATRTFAAAVHAADGRPFLRGWRLSLLDDGGGR